MKEEIDPKIKNNLTNTRLDNNIESIIPPFKPVFLYMKFKQIKLIINKITGFNQLGNFLLLKKVLNYYLILHL